MKKYTVLIRSADYGQFEIEANSSDEAEQIAQERLESGDISWMNNANGVCEVEEVIENA